MNKRGSRDPMHMHLRDPTAALSSLISSILFGGSSRCQGLSLVASRIAFRISHALVY